MKKNRKKGFTLAELLVVVAIIGVLVAIAIPTFTAQLKKAEHATDVANVRSHYAELITNDMGDSTFTGSATYSLASDFSDVADHSNLTPAADGHGIVVTHSTGTPTATITVSANVTITN